MLKELNSLINVRNFLNLSINDLSVQMSSEKSTAISRKIAELNKQILNMALLLDVEKIVADATNEGARISSTKEIKNVEELDKLVAIGNKISKLKNKQSVKTNTNEMAK